MQRRNEPIIVAANIKYHHAPSASHLNRIRTGVSFTDLCNVFPLRGTDNHAPCLQIFGGFWKFFRRLNQKAFLNEPHGDNLSATKAGVNLKARNESLGQIWNRQRTLRQNRHARIGSELL